MRDTRCSVLRGLALAALIAFPNVALAQSPGGVIPPAGGGGNGETVDVGALLKTFSDENAKLPEREEAIKQATQLVWRMDPDARNKSGLKEAAAALLEKLSTPANLSQAQWGKLTGYAFNALAPYKPLSDIDKIAKPYVEKGPPLAQQGAINALTTHGGGSSFAAEYIKILDLCGEESSKGQMDRAQKLERPIIEGARVLATTGVAKDRADAVRILLTALKKTHTNNILRYTMNYLGDLKDPKAIGPLLEIASATAPHADMACEAARALTKCGSDAGIEQLIKRFDNGGGTLIVYQTICELSFHGDGGFANVPVVKYNAIGPGMQGKIMQEMHAWWESIKGKDADENLYQTLSAAGVKLPSNRQDKELVTGLIDALGICATNRDLKYAALECLVRKLIPHPTEFINAFKTISMDVGGGGAGGGPPAAGGAAGPKINMNKIEPAGGFGDPKDQQELLKQQVTRVEKFKEWWNSVKDKAKSEGSGASFGWRIPDDASKPPGTTPDKP